MFCFRVRDKEKTVAQNTANYTFLNLTLFELCTDNKPILLSTKEGKHGHDVKTTTRLQQAVK